jgi:hypothetical protein
MASHKFKIGEIVTIRQSLTPKPGIREQYRPEPDLGWVEIPQRSSLLPYRWRAINSAHSLPVRLRSTKTVRQTHF